MVQRWATELSVVARHYPGSSTTPTRSNGYCVLAMEGDTAMLACELPDGTTYSQTLDAANIPDLLMFHDMLVPRWRVVDSAPLRLAAADTCSQMMMFNALRNRLRPLK